MTNAVVRTPIDCPCGSGLGYAECCGALHRGRGPGRLTAATAERLMRSRFSAFAVGDVTYLLLTWHPTTRPPSLVLDPGLEWRRLEICESTAGSEHDAEGTVEFVAHFWDTTERRRGRLHERSAFVRKDGQWFYVGAAPAAIDPATTVARRR